jgi:hypothetical protein
MPLVVDANGDLVTICGQLVSCNENTPMRLCPCPCAGVFAVDHTFYLIAPCTLAVTIAGWGNTDPEQEPNCLVINDDYEVPATSLCDWGDVFVTGGFGEQVARSIDVNYFCCEDGGDAVLGIIVTVLISSDQTFGQYTAKYYVELARVPNDPGCTIVRLENNTVLPFVPAADTDGCLTVPSDDPIAICDPTGSTVTLNAA